MRRQIIDDSYSENVCKDNQYFYEVFGRDRFW